MSIDFLVIFGYVLGIAIAVVMVKINAWLNHLDNDKRLLSDAEYQHRKLMEGDDAVGIYGRYQP